MQGEFYVGLCPSWASAVAGDTDLNAGTKLVLLILDRHMTSMGQFQWPGKRRLAQLCGVDEKLVTKALKTARDLGWLHYQRGFGDDDSIYSPTIPADSAKWGGFWVKGAQCQGLDHLTVDQERARLKTELAALEDTTVLEAIENLGGRITNIQTLSEEE